MADPYVSRRQMPQIDEKDIAKLLVFVGRAGYGIRAGETLPTQFISHQAVDPVKVDRMKDEVLAKPVICTKAYEIIDGNHRLQAHHIRETIVPYIMLDMTFVEALDLLTVFPFAYELNDLTPERN